MFKDSLGKLTQKQDLTTQEVTEFVEAMRDDQVTDVQIAGFLVALLMKGPTVDEVAAIGGHLLGQRLADTSRRLGQNPVRPTSQAERPSSHSSSVTDGTSDTMRGVSPAASR